MKKSTLIPLTVIILTILIGTVVFLYIKAKQKSLVSTYDECVAQGNPILDSFPEQCKTPDGKTFYNRQNGQGITVTGEIICLPHKDQNSPHTLECAYGVKSETGENFGLSDPEMESITKFGTGNKVSISGKFKSNLENNIYDSVGIIEITSISKI